MCSRSASRTPPGASRKPEAPRRRQCRPISPSNRHKEYGVCDPARSQPTSKANSSSRCHVLFRPRGATIVLQFPPKESNPVRCISLVPNRRPSHEPSVVLAFRTVTRLSGPKSSIAGALPERKVKIERQKPDCPPQIIMPVLAR